ncbi:holin family protein [Comamonadaceae bacterium M7527]|nr:holin family protein [Comamonadaceae bacterium M7527]
MILDELLSVGGKLIDKLIPDPKAKDQAKIQLERMAREGELAAMANETKLFEAEVADRGSAREREFKVATSADAPLISKIVAPVLAMGTVVMTFIMFAVLVFVDVQPGQKDILIYLLGALSSAMTIILSYYFGSSSGSAAKDSKLHGLIK